MDFDEHELPDEGEIIEFLESLPPEVNEQLQILIQGLMAELILTPDKEHDVVFCGSNGKNIIKCVHYDRRVLDGDGPIILPSANPFVTLAAISTEIVNETVSEYKNVYPDPEVCESHWQAFLDNTASDIASLAESTTPTRWEQLLDEGFDD
jgi:acetone carboxylase gamma subunit